MARVFHDVEMERVPDPEPFRRRITELFEHSRGNKIPDNVPYNCPSDSLFLSLISLKSKITTRLTSTLVVPKFSQANPQYVRLPQHLRHPADNPQ